MLSLLIFIGEACVTPSTRERRLMSKAHDTLLLSVAICRWTSIRAVTPDGGRPHLL
jgi:hypothetical protein